MEHIWANHYERFSAQFEQQADFDRARNQIGGLLLLPKKINASLNDKTYKEKLPHYLKGNPLTRSLHTAAYQNNPGFQQTIRKYKLDFTAYESFDQLELAERSQLYCQLASLIWSADRLLAE